jgi:hypothetical protein
MRKQYSKTGPMAFANKCADAISISKLGGDSKDWCYIGSIEVGNSSGDDASCGWGLELPDDMWYAGQYDASATPHFVDDTTDAQDAGTGDFPLGADGEDGDGIVVQAKRPFSVVGFDLSEAGSGGGIATPTFQYWNGSAWTTLPTFSVPDFTSTAAYEYLVIHKPIDWAPLVSTDSPVASHGLTAGMYAIKIVWATAPTNAAVADSIWLVDLRDFVEAVGDGKSVTLSTEGEIMLSWKGNIVPFCSTADEDNWINIEFRLG